MSAVYSLPNYADFREMVMLCNVGFFIWRNSPPVG